MFFLSFLNVKMKFQFTSVETDLQLTTWSLEFGVLGLSVCYGGSGLPTLTCLVCVAGVSPGSGQVVGNRSLECTADHVSKYEHAHRARVW